MEGCNIYLGDVVRFTSSTWVFGSSTSSVLVLMGHPNLQTAKHLWKGPRVLGSQGAWYDFPGALTFEVPPPLPAFPGAWKIQANLVTYVLSCHAMSHVTLVAK